MGRAEGLTTVPFAYFGAKHGLARTYPPPVTGTVIEPFAGSAGYACYWARQGIVSHAILIDNRPAVIDTWLRLKRMSIEELFMLEIPPKGTKTLDPLLLNGGRQGIDAMRGRAQAITDRMIDDWPKVQRRIALTLDLIRDWEIVLGDYRDAPDIYADWFIDPPYTPKIGNDGTLKAGGVSYHADSLDYQSLADWCLRRSGHVIVCEQDPAKWLPFTHHKRQRNGVGRGTYAVRTELIYHRLDSS